MTAKYICLEGTDGVGKSTQTDLLVEHLRSKGYKVLKTSEPGTKHLELTLTLRNLMLDEQYNEMLPATSRELLSQVIRNIHLEKLIIPALDKYDYIIQDRGILSGLAYGKALGNSLVFLEDMCDTVTHRVRQRLDLSNPYFMYDTVIYLKSNKISKNLQKAKKSKKEFEKGDTIENRGVDFMKSVNKNMQVFSKFFDTINIDIDDKSIKDVSKEIISRLDIK